VRCRRVRVQCGTDCGVRRRLLGFFISTIVLGLLTKGFKISVQKVAFMTVQGIKVEVPEWGMLLQVEEISLVTNLHGAKWFTLQVHRPRVEVDLSLCMDRVQQGRQQARVAVSQAFASVGVSQAARLGVSEAARRNVSSAPAPSPRPEEPPWAAAAATGARAAPGWVNGVMQVVVPPLADMLLRAVAACFELVVIQSAARITVPMVGPVCLALEQLAVSLNTTSVTASASAGSKEAGLRGSKSKPALALSVSTQRLLISQDPQILTAWAQAAAAGASRAGGGAGAWQRGASLQASMHASTRGSNSRPGTLAPLGGDGREQRREQSREQRREESWQPDALGPAKSPGCPGLGTGADKLHDGVRLAVEPSLLACVFAVRVRLHSAAAVDGKIYRVVLDVGYAETEMQESFLFKALEAQALIASALGPVPDAGGKRAQAGDARFGAGVQGAPPASSAPRTLHASGQVQKAFAMVPTECVFALGGVAAVLHMVKESESVPAYVNPMLDPRHSAGMEFKLTPMRIKMHKAVRQVEAAQDHASHRASDRASSTLPHSLLSHSNPQNTDSGTEAGRRGEQAGDGEAGDGEPGDARHVHGLQGHGHVVDNADSLTLSCGGYNPDGASQPPPSRPQGFGLSVAETQEGQMVHLGGMEGLCINLTLLLPVSLLALSPESQDSNHRANTEHAASISLACTLAAVHCEVEPLGKFRVLHLLDNLKDKQEQLLPDTPDMSVPSAAHRRFQMDGRLAREEPPPHHAWQGGSGGWLPQSSLASAYAGVGGYGSGAGAMPAGAYAAGRPGMGGTVFCIVDLRS